MKTPEGFTTKELKFIDLLFEGKTQLDAYKEVYNTKGRSYNGISVSASHKANQPKIKARLEELRRGTIERHMVTVDNVIRELANIAFDDISNYLEYRTEKQVVAVDRETGEQIIDYRTVVELKDSKTIDTRNISEISVTKDGTFKFKQYAKDGALEKLGRILGMFVDKVEQSNTNTNLNIGENQVSVKFTDDKIQKAYEALYGECTAEARGKRKDTGKKVTPK